MGLEFGLLGPLEVRRDGSPVPLRGRRQRALLALLLLHANEIVPSERLIEELFADATPAGAPNALHAAVSRLRRQLDCADAVLVTRPGGYAVEASPGQLDVAGSSGYSPKDAQPWPTAIPRLQPQSCAERWRSGAGLCSSTCPRSSSCRGRSGVSTSFDWPR